MKKIYPIFISYRRIETADKAEHLLSLLESKGYKDRVSFDRDNFDGLFDIEILQRLDNCTDFIVILGYHTLDNLNPDDTQWYCRLATCSVDEFPNIENEMKKGGVNLDFVRLEIARAIAKGKHIIPIVPTANDGYDFDRLSLPEDVSKLLKQQAEKYLDSKDFLFKNILPRVVKRLKSPSHSYRWLRWTIGCFVILLFVLGLLAGLQYGKESKLFENCRTQDDYCKLMDLSCGFFVGACQDSIDEFVRIKSDGYVPINDPNNGDLIKVNWDDECSLQQIRIVKNIIAYMMRVPSGQFMMGTDDPIGHEEIPHMETIDNCYYIGKFEVTELQWNVVMQDSLKGSATLPMREISFVDCTAFVSKLCSMTKNLFFTLPTEVEWEYAARYGEQLDWKYAGSSDPDSVAWFSENSDGKPGASGKKKPNALELYDMSGNVSEWCMDGQGSKRRIRGGSYESSRMLITTTFSDAASAELPSPQIGMRLVLKNTSQYEKLKVD